MKFSTQNLPDVEHVSAADIERAFEQNEFGKYAHLSVSEDVFLQAGSRGRPSACRGSCDEPLVAELAGFIEQTGSEPWILEHIDGVARKVHQVKRNLTFDQVRAAFLEYLNSGGHWRQGHEWVELDTRNNPFPNPMPDTAFESVETISNEDLRVDHLPAPDARAAEVWRFADTFNGFKHWGSIDRCAEIANAQRDGDLTELRTCLFFECRRWHYFGELPDRHASPFIRDLVERIRMMVAARKTE